MTLQNPICVALDTPELPRALELAKLLHGHVGMLKIGMEFFYAHGSRGYEALGAHGIPIFLDMKLQIGKSTRLNFRAPCHWPSNFSAMLAC